MAALALGLAFTAASASAKSAVPACGAMQTVDEKVANGNGNGNINKEEKEDGEKRADIVEIRDIPENSTVTVDKDWITITTPDGKVKRIRTPRPH